MLQQYIPEEDGNSRPRRVMLDRELHAQSSACSELAQSRIWNEAVHDTEAARSK